MIKVNKEELVNAISKCQKARRSQYIKVSVNGSSMTLTSCSDYMGVITTIPAFADENAEFVLDSEKFAPVISKALADDIQVFVENDNVRFKAGRMDAVIQKSVAPVIERRLSDDEEQFTAEVELDKITVCSHALNYGMDDFRFSSYYIEFLENGYAVTALDGHRVSYRKYGSGSKTKELIVSGKGLNDIQTIMGKNPVKLKIGDKSRFVQFEDDANIITVSCYAGGYFQLGNFLQPGEFSLTVNRQELIDALTVTTIFNTSSSFTLKDGIITIETKATSGKSKVECAYRSNDTIDMRIGLNAAFVIDALKSIDQEDIKISITSRTKPVMIGEGDMTEVIMPVAIQ